MPTATLKRPDEEERDKQDDGWYKNMGKNHGDGLQESWDADNSDYDEKNPKSKASPKEFDGKDLAEKESSVSKNSGEDFNAPTAKEKNQFNYGGYDPVTDTESGATTGWQRVRGKVTRGRVLAGGGIVALLLGGFGITSFISGPLKILHVGQFLRQAHLDRPENDSDIRTSRLIRALRSGDAKNLRLGRTARKFADRWETKILQNTGMRSLYHPTTGRFVGYEIVDPEKAKDTVGTLERDGINAEVKDVDFVDGSGKSVRQGASIVDVSDAKFRNRRSLIRSVVNGADIDGVTGSVASRIMQKLGGVDFHPLKNARREATDKLIDFYIKQKEQRAERNAEGVQEPNARAPDTDADGDGTPDSSDPDTPDDVTPDAASREAADAAAEAIEDIDGVKIEVPRTSPRFIEQLRTIANSSAAKVAGGAAAAVGILCAVKTLGDAAELVQYSNVILPMIRMGMVFVSASDQIKSGIDVNYEELGALSDDLFDKDLNAGFDAAQPWVAASGKDPTGGYKIPKEAKPNKVGEKPDVFATIDEVPFLGTACNINDTIGNLPIIKEVGQVSSYLIDQALGLFGTSQDEIMSTLINALAGAGVNLFAKGPLLGNYLMYGARLASNMTSFAAGGLLLNDTEEAQLRVRDQRIAWENQKDKSIASRLFDLKDADSLGSKLSMLWPKNMTELRGVYSNTTNRLANAFSPRVSAASIPYDYGFNLVGTSVADMESEIYTEPIENAVIVEQNIDSLVNKYGKCFPRKVNPSDRVNLPLIDNELDRMDTPPTDDDCNDRSENLRRYSAYLAYRSDEDALGCYEGDQASCESAGFAGGGTIASNGGVATELNLNGPKIACTGNPSQERIVGARNDTIDWSGITPTGTIGQNSGGQPINVYVRDACTTTNMQTVVIASSIHASENYGQQVSFELLFRKSIPSNMRIIAIPEVNGSGITSSVPRVNANGVNLNRNFNYRWDAMSGDELNSSSTNYRGTAPESEPETKAVVAFLKSIGNVSALFAYHDNLNYVGSSGATSPTYATKYRNYLNANRINMGLGNSGGVNILQKGSLDGWFNEATGFPSILVEMPAVVSEEQISTHASAVLSTIDPGVIR